MRAEYRPELASRRRRIAAKPHNRAGGAPREACWDRVRLPRRGPRQAPAEIDRPGPAATAPSGRAAPAGRDDGAVSHRRPGDRGRPQIPSARLRARRSRTRPRAPASRRRRAPGYSGSRSPLVAERAQRTLDLARASARHWRGRTVMQDASSAQAANPSSSRAPRAASARRACASRSQRAGASARSTSTSRTRSGLPAESALRASSRCRPTWPTRAPAPPRWRPRCASSAASTASSTWRRSIPRSTWRELDAAEFQRTLARQRHRLASSWRRPARAPWRRAAAAPSCSQAPAL